MAPDLWMTFVINKAEHSQDLLHLINSRDPHIQFTVEPTKPRITTILGHPRHHTTRQHIQHHGLQETHTHRPIPPLGQQPPHYCQTKCIQHPSPPRQNSIFNTGQLEKEFTHIKTDLYHCQFPLKGPQPVGAQVQPATTSCSSCQQQQQQQQQLIQQQQIQSNHSGSLHQQTAEKFKRLCKSRGIQVHFKGTNTLRTALGNPKDKDPKPTKQASSTNTNAHISTAPAPTLGSLADPWGKELRNISRPLPPYPTTEPPQDIPSTPTSLTFFTKR